MDGNVLLSIIPWLIFAHTLAAPLTKESITLKINTGKGPDFITEISLDPIGITTHYEFSEGQDSGTEEAQIHEGTDISSQNNSSSKNSETSELHHENNGVVSLKTSGATTDGSLVNKPRATNGNSDKTSDVSTSIDAKTVPGEEMVTSASVNAMVTEKHPSVTSEGDLVRDKSKDNTDDKSGSAVNKSSSSVSTKDKNIRIFDSSDASGESENNQQPVEDKSKGTSIISGKTNLSTTLNNSPKQSDVDSNAKKPNSLAVSVTKNQESNGSFHQTTEKVENQIQVNPKILNDNKEEVSKNNSTLASSGISNSGALNDGTQRDLKNVPPFKTGSQSINVSSDNKMLDIATKMTSKDNTTINMPPDSKKATPTGSKTVEEKPESSTHNDESDSSIKSPTMTAESTPSRAKMLDIAINVASKDNTTINMPSSDKKEPMSSGITTVEEKHESSTSKYGSDSSIKSPTMTAGSTSSGADTLDRTQTPQPKEKPTKTGIQLL